MSTTTATMTASSTHLPIGAIIDSVSQQTPNKQFIRIPQETTSTKGAKTVTFFQMARAVDRAAAWLEETLGKAQNFPAYSFMAHNFDVRYLIFFYAGIKSGHKTFFPSPRNSHEFHLHLIKKLEVKTIVSAIPVGSYAQTAKCAIVEPPSVDELFADGEVKPFPYTKTLEEALNDPICVMHSSGSTGPPKPITWTNGFMENSLKISKASEAVRGADLFAHTFNPEKASLIAMPLFHSAGFLCCAVGITYLGGSITIFPAKAILNADNFISAIEAFDVKHAAVPPSILEDIAADEVKLKALSRLEHAFFAGAGIAEEAGAIVNRYTKVFSNIGSTEASFYPVQVLQGEEKRHAWMEYMPLSGFVMREQDDGLFELVFERTDKFDWPVFYTFPDKSEYATSELYEKHPTVPNAWRLVGRKDDVLVLSNGEKVVPLPMEETFRMAPEVHGALYFGQGKFTVGVLLELNEQATTGLSEEKLIQLLHPYAQKANEMAPAFGQLTKEMIIYTSKDKPFGRAPKGSVLRRATIANYSEEIEALYLRQDAQAVVPLVKDLEAADTKKALLEIFNSLTGKHLLADEDLFQSAGTDSMQVINATRQIKACVQAEAPESAGKVTASLIYQNPTISQLTAAVRSLVLTGKADADVRDAGAAIEAMIKKYSEGIPQAVPIVENTSDKYNVLLTGSTGSLGSYMLSLLINNPAVGKVFALNRSDDVEDRQLSNNTARGLATDMTKVVFFKAALGNKNLGLNPKEYQELVNSTDLIVHNAWPVNFNQSLESFEPHIRGVRNFIDLSAASPRRPHLVFISTIGTLADWETFHPDQPKPEVIIDDSRPAQGAGYGEGKFVSEHLLAAATAKGISTTVARVGQVAGPVESVKGEWNRQEWVPSIVFSSAHMGIIPSDIGAGVTNWTPVDAMAKIVLELGAHGVRHGHKAATTSVYNLTNPNDGSWAQLVPAMRARLPQIKKEVPWSQWYDQLLADSQDNATDATAHPAVKLVDFYASLNVDAANYHAEPFCTDNAVAVSKTMAGLGSVSSEWMNTWMTQWGF